MLLMAGEIVRDWFREREEREREEELLGAWQTLYEDEYAARRRAEERLMECLTLR